jgi:hypothetical protein
MSTPRIERETIITFNEEEDEAMIWSASPTFQRKIERRGFTHYRASTRDGDGGVESRYYRVPKRFVSVRPLRRMPELTEEQRQVRSDAARERFRKRAPSEISNSSPGD